MAKHRIELMQFFHALDQGGSQSMEFAPWCAELVARDPVVRFKQLAPGAALSELRYAIQEVTKMIKIAIGLAHFSLVCASQAPPFSASEPELMEFKQALPDGTSRNLEKTETSMVAKGNNAFVRYTLYSKFKFVYQINGEKSPVRLAQPGAYKFLVRLRPSDNPGNVLQFFKVDRINGKRFLAPPVQNKKSDNERPFVSESAGALVSIGVGRLEPGEYCLGLNYTNEGYCFGIDQSEK